MVALCCRGDLSKRGNRELCLPRGTGAGQAARGRMWMPCHFSGAYGKLDELIGVP